MGIINFRIVIDVLGGIKALNGNLQNVIDFLLTIVFLLKGLVLSYVEVKGSITIKLRPVVLACTIPLFL